MGSGSIRQAKAYERHWRRINTTVPTMSSCMRRDFGVEFSRFICIHYTKSCYLSRSKFYIIFEVHVILTWVLCYPVRQHFYIRMFGFLPFFPQHWQKCQYIQSIYEFPFPDTCSCNCIYIQLTKTLSADLCNMTYA